MSSSLVNLMLQRILEGSDKAPEYAAQVLAIVEALEQQNQALLNMVKGD